MNKLENFAKVKVLVVGDVMVDKYLRGDVTRISPEAPVPVVRLKETDYRAGGAGNVAANIAGLGATAHLIGLVGDDFEGRVLRDVLEKAGVSSKHIVKSKTQNLQTTVKTRIIAHNQQIARLDTETIEELEASDEKGIWENFQEVISDCNLIVLSDYAKGVLSQSLLSRLIEYGRVNKKPVVVDPKGKDYTKYQNASIITPNKFEIAEACNCRSDQTDELAAAGQKLISDLNLAAVLITRGEEGIMLIENNREPLILGAVGRRVYDVTGAGDTFISTLAVALGAEESLSRAAFIANTAAGLAVEEVGTTIIKLKDLQSVIEEDFNNNI